MILELYGPLPFNQYVNNYNRNRSKSYDLYFVSDFFYEPLISDYDIDSN